MPTAFHCAFITLPPFHSTHLSLPVLQSLSAISIWPTIPLHGNEERPTIPAPPRHAYVVTVCRGPYAKFVILRCCRRDEGTRTNSGLRSDWTRRLTFYVTFSVMETGMDVFGSFMFITLDQISSRVSLKLIFTTDYLQSIPTHTE